MRRNNLNPEKDKPITRLSNKILKLGLMTALLFVIATTVNNAWAAQYTHNGTAWNPTTTSSYAATDTIVVNISSLGGVVEIDLNSGFNNATSFGCIHIAALPDDISTTTVTINLPTNAVVGRIIGTASNSNDVLFNVNNSNGGTFTLNGQLVTLSAGKIPSIAKNVRMTGYIPATTTNPPHNGRLSVRFDRAGAGNYTYLVIKSTRPQADLVNDLKDFTNYEANKGLTTISGFVSAYNAVNTGNQIEAADVKIITSARASISTVFNNCTNGQGYTIAVLGINTTAPGGSVEEVNVLPTIDAASSATVYCKTFSTTDEWIYSYNTYRVAWEWSSTTLNAYLGFQNGGRVVVDVNNSATFVDPDFSGFAGKRISKLTLTAGTSNPSFLGFDFADGAWSLPDNVQLDTLEITTNPGFNANISGIPSEVVIGALIGPANGNSKTTTFYTGNTAQWFGYINGRNLTFNATKGNQIVVIGNIENVGDGLADFQISASGTSYQDFSITHANCLVITDDSKLTANNIIVIGSGGLRKFTNANNSFSTSTSTLSCAGHILGITTELQNVTLTMNITNSEGVISPTILKGLVIGGSNSMQVKADKLEVLGTGGLVRNSPSSAFSTTRTALSCGGDITGITTELQNVNLTVTNGGTLTLSPTILAGFNINANDLTEAAVINLPNLTAVNGDVNLLGHSGSVLNITDITVNATALATINGNITVTGATAANTSSFITFNDGALTTFSNGNITATGATVEPTGTQSENTNAISIRAFDKNSDITGDINITRGNAADAANAAKVGITFWGKNLTHGVITGLQTITGDIVVNGTVNGTAHNGDVYINVGMLTDVKKTNLQATNGDVTLNRGNSALRNCNIVAYSLKSIEGDLTLNMPGTFTNKNSDEIAYLPLNIQTIGGNCTIAAGDIAFGIPESTPGTLMIAPQTLAIGGDLSVAGGANAYFLSGAIVDGSITHDNNVFGRICEAVASTGTPLTANDWDNANSWTITANDNWPKQNKNVADKLKIPDLAVGITAYPTDVDMISFVDKAVLTLGANREAWGITCPATAASATIDFGTAPTAYTLTLNGKTTRNELLNMADFLEVCPEFKGAIVNNIYAAESNGTARTGTAPFKTNETTLYFRVELDRPYYTPLASDFVITGMPQTASGLLAVSDITGETSAYLVTLTITDATPTVFTESLGTEIGIELATNPASTLMMNTTPTPANQKYNVKRIFQATAYISNPNLTISNTGVAITANASAQLTFSEAVLIGQNKVKMMHGSPATELSPVTNAASTAANQTVAFIYPVLAYNTTYTINIAANEVTDTWGNKNASLIAVTPATTTTPAQTYYLSFTTKERASITSIVRCDASGGTTPAIAEKTNANTVYFKVSFASQPDAPAPAPADFTYLGITSSVVNIGDWIYDNAVSGPGYYIFTVATPPASTQVAGVDVKITGLTTNSSLTYTWNINAQTGTNEKYNVRKAFLATVTNLTIADATSTLNGIIDAPIFGTGTYTFNEPLLLGQDNIFQIAPKSNTNLIVANGITNPTISTASNTLGITYGGQAGAHKLADQTQYSIMLNTFTFTDAWGNTLTNTASPTEKDRFLAEQHRLFTTKKLPRITAITRNVPTNEFTNANSVTFQITFDMSVTNFAATNLVVKGSNTTNGGAFEAVTTGTVAGSGTTWTVQYDVTNDTAYVGVTGVTVNNKYMMGETVASITPKTAQTFYGQYYHIKRTFDATITTYSPAENAPISKADASIDFSEPVTVGVDAFTLTENGQSEPESISNEATTVLAARVFFKYGSSVASGTDLKHSATYVIAQAAPNSIKDKWGNSPATVLTFPTTTVGNTTLAGGIFTRAAITALSVDRCDVNGINSTLADPEYTNAKIVYLKVTFSEDLTETPEISNFSVTAGAISAVAWDINTPSTAILTILTSHIADDPNGIVVQMNNLTGGDFEWTNHVPATNQYYNVKLQANAVTMSIAPDMNDAPTGTETITFSEVVTIGADAFTITGTKSGQTPTITNTAVTTPATTVDVNYAGTVTGDTYTVGVKTAATILDRWGNIVTHPTAVTFKTKPGIASIVRCNSDGTTTQTLSNGSIVGINEYTCQPNVYFKVTFDDNLPAGTTLNTTDFTLQAGIGEISAVSMAAGGLNTAIVNVSTNNIAYDVNGKIIKITGVGQVASFIFGNPNPHEQYNFRNQFTTNLDVSITINNTANPTTNVSIIAAGQASSNFVTLSETGITPEGNLQFIGIAPTAGVPTVSTPLTSGASNVSVTNMSFMYGTQGIDPLQYASHYRVVIPVGALRDKWGKENTGEIVCISDMATQAAPPTFTITATVRGNVGGTAVANPSTVNQYGQSIVTFTPTNSNWVVKGYRIGGGAGAFVASSATSYTFYNVTSNQSIEVEFEQTKFDITTSVSSAGGTISASANVNKGNNHTVYITPYTCYKVATFTDNQVDQTSAINNGTYLLSNVQADHNIVVTFEKIRYHIQTSVLPTGTTSAVGTISATGLDQSGYADCGGNVTLTATAAQGYTFSNWTENGNVVYGYPSYTFGATSDRSLVANFTQNTHTITANASANGSISPTGTQTVAQGSDQTFTFNPSTGYEVDVVTVDGSVVTPTTPTTYTFTNVQANHTIYVTFRQITHTITASAGTGQGSANGSISPAGAQTVINGSNRTFTFTPDSGYEVDEVTVDGSVVTPTTPTTHTFTNVTADHTINVTFKRIVRTVTFVVTDAAGVPIQDANIAVAGLTQQPQPTDQNGKTTINLESGVHSYTATATGYQDILSTSFTVGTVDITVNVTMTLKQFNILASVNPTAGGSATGTGTYNYGASVTLTATANVGYHFVNWTDGQSVVSSSATYMFLATANRTLVANFVINTYTISASANPIAGGNITGAGTYNHNATVTLTATPAQGYHFVNWTDGQSVVSSSATYTFPVTGHRTLVANFGQITHNVTAIAGANGIIASSGTTVAAGTQHVFTVAQGATQAFAITPNVGYAIDVVTLNGATWSPTSQTPGTTTYTITAASTASISVTFKPITYTITATAGQGGTISPSGAVTVNQGANQSFTFAANAGYVIGTVTVDGTPISLTAANTYTFTNVTTNHTINVTFNAVVPAVTGITRTGGAAEYTNAQTVSFTIATVNVPAGATLGVTVSNNAIVGPTITRTGDNFVVIVTPPTAAAITATEVAITEVTINGTVAPISGVNESYNVKQSFTTTANLTAPAATDAELSGTGTVAFSDPVSLGANTITLNGTAATNGAISNANTANFTYSNLTASTTYTVGFGTVTDRWGNTGTPTTPAAGGRLTFETTANLVPSMLSASAQAVNSQSISLSWSTDNAAGVLVCVKTNPNAPATPTVAGVTNTSFNGTAFSGKWAKSTSATGTNVQWTGLARNTQYHIFIYAYNAAGVVSSPIMVSAKTPFVKEAIEMSNNGVFEITDITPSPANEVASFNLFASENGNLYVSLYDLSGSKVLDVIKGEPVSAGTDLRIPIDVRELASGVYTVVISIGEDRITRSIVIKK